MTGVLKLLVWMGLVGAAASAQQLSLSVQDLGGASLPVSCTEVGQRFTLTSTAALYICNGSNFVLSSGSGSGGICTVTRTSTTVLTIAASATSMTPCVPGFGNATVRITSPITCTVSTNGGTAYIYFDSSGGVICGYGGGTFAGGNVTSSGGTATFGITSYPTSSLRLWRWTATSGTWDASGGTRDLPEASASKDCVAGSGITVTDDGKTCTIVATGTGSAPYSYFKGPQTAVTQTGSNVDAFTAITSVPALAAGGCYVIEAGVINDGGTGAAIAFSVYVDSTSVYVAYNGTGIADNIQLKALYCNQNGVQNAQTTVSYPTFYANSPSAPASILSTTYTANPSAIDWTTTHTIHIYTNVASGTITPKFVHIATQ